MIEKRIKFTQEYEVQDNSGTKYQDGQEINLPVPSCQHFVKRGVAIYVEKSAEIEVKPEVEQKKTTKKSKKLINAKVTNTKLG